MCQISSKEREQVKKALGFNNKKSEKVESLSQESQYAIKQERIFEKIHKD